MASIMVLSTLAPEIIRPKKSLSGVFSKTMLSADMLEYLFGTNQIICGRFAGLNHLHTHNQVASFLGN